MNTNPKLNDKDLANQLAARLDANLLTPTTEDSDEMKSLLQIYTHLQAAISEPDPAFVRQLKRSLGREAKKGSLGLTFRWPQWLSWPRRNWQPLLAMLVVIAVVIISFAPTYTPPTPPDLSPAPTVPPSVTNLLAPVSVTEEIDAYTFSGATDDRVRILVPGGSLRPSFNWTDVMGATSYTLQIPTDSTYYWHVFASNSNTIQWYDATWYIVRRGELSLAVDDTSVSMSRLQQIVAEQQGLVVSTTAGRTTQGDLTTVISLQVPANIFEQALSQIKTAGTEVIFERVTSQDVTASHIDLEARLRNLQLTETELQALLQSSQERGDKAEDILAIYKSLSDIRGQIEQLKAQKNLLEKSVAMAQIDIALIPESAAPGFRPEQVLNQAWTQLLQVLQRIATGLIWGAVFAPLGIALAVVVVMTWRWAKRIFVEDSEPDEEEAEEIDEEDEEPEEEREEKE